MNGVFLVHTQSVEVWAEIEPGSDEGPVNVTVLGNATPPWMEKRTGLVMVYRRTRYEFGRTGDREFTTIKRVVVRTPSADIHVEGPSIKAALKAFGERIAEQVVAERQKGVPA